MLQVYWSAKYDYEGPKELKPTPASEERATGFGRLSELASSIVEQQPLLEEEDPELEAAKFWMPVRSKSASKHQGKLLLSVQLVPVAFVDGLPAGKGRGEPNRNPTLPKPVGRLKFSLNPFKMLSQMIGPKYCGKLARGCCCLLCLVITVLMIYYMVPVVFGNIITAPISG